jgi:hypothetical protein
MSPNLITRERAQQNVAQATLSAAEAALLDRLVAAVSEAIRRYCNRDFVAQSYDELYDGSGTPELILNHAPVLAVERVATSPTAVLTANQRATVQVTGDGLTLTRVASGTVVADSSVTWQANPTLGAVATAIDALGNGWDATVRSPYALWPSADLRSIQGALSCAQSRPAGLVLHLDELAAYSIRADEGILVYGAAGWGPVFPWEESFGRPCWERGRGLYRVVYTAGYEGVPEPVQEAAAEWAAALWWQAKRDPAAVQVQVPGAGAQLFSGKLELPGYLKVLLAPYRRFVIGGV